MSPAKDAANPDTWATFLRATRKAKGLTQEELADEAGVGRQTIIRWERGDRGVDADTLRKVTDVLGVSYAAALSLLHNADPDVPQPPPLPASLARLVALYSDMDSADRELLLERVDWVSEWAELRLASTTHARTIAGRRRRRTG